MLAPLVDAKEMQSTIDASIAVSDSRGVKRPALPLSPRLSSSAEHRQPLLEHELLPTSQACYQKRLRTSDSKAPLKSRNTHVASATAPSSTYGSDFREPEAKVAEEVRKPNYEGLGTTQHSRPDSEPPGPGKDFKPRRRFYNFFTKASIYTPKGVIDLERVHVDERCPFNLVPWSMATNLDLILYSGEASTHPLNQINQYSQFTIRVAGHTTTINTGVISGLQTILLGREWIRSVHLLSDSGNQNYYIPIPLAVQVAEEKLLDKVNTEVASKDANPLEMTTCEEIAEAHEDDELYQSSPDDEVFSESELSFDGQDILHSDGPSDEPSSGCDALSDGETTREQTREYDVRPTNEYDEDDEGDEGDEGDGNDHGEDDEDYKDCEGNVGDECDGCEGCEECDGYTECEGCAECKGFEYEGFGEGAEDPDDNLLERYIHLESITDAEHTKEARCQHSDSKDEQVRTATLFIPG
ncbi:MAG: hypothetical protein CL912_19585 [Deltaproteobacteria bacterium]|nr:hypothetical protein [Deltaproteobacteria bacterium]